MTVQAGPLLVVLGTLLAACTSSPGERRPVWTPGDDVAVAEDAPDAQAQGDAAPLTAVAGTLSHDALDEVPWSDTGGDTAVESEEPEPEPEGVAPGCAILAPADRTVVPAGTSIDFRGTATDEDDDLDYVLWSSDLWGPMVYGTAFPFILPPGAHQVTLTAVDERGHVCVRSIRVTVTR